jgi:hypothetical protein
MKPYFIWETRLKTEFEDTLIWAVGVDGINPIEAFKKLSEAKQSCCRLNDEAWENELE